MTFCNKISTFMELYAIHLGSVEISQMNLQERHVSCPASFSTDRGFLFSDMKPYTWQE